MGLNLINLSLSFLLSIFITRFSCIYYYNKNKHIKETKKKEVENTSTIPYISGSAIKLGLATMGSVIINRAPIIIAGIAFSLNLAGAFTLTMQIFLAIISVSNVYLAIKIPQLSQLVIKSQRSEVRALVIKIIIRSILLYLLGVVFFVLFSDVIIKITGAKIGFLDREYILILSVVFLLDLNHNICASILTTGNKIPFVIPVIASGCLIALLGWVLSVPMHMGVIGLILAQGIVQIAYNNWKWPLMVYKDYIKR